MKKYSTKDFYLSGFLLSEGFSLIEASRENGYTEFSFNDNTELKNSVTRFYLSKATVDPIIYGQTLRQLKGLMHNSSLSMQNKYNNNEYQTTKK